ncbi:MAG: DegT/DnrJ/EryC1/StrS family aminotransferase [Solirubrobacteraceae bacterium]
MREIKMVDLASQYQKIKPEIDTAILEVLENASFINGPAVGFFQKELEANLNIKHVIPCANGTDALQIALMALNLVPGDEVITTDFTFAASVEVIHLLKLKSVLVDVDYNTFTIDINAIKKAITPKTKAIIPVHIFGQCANMEEIIKLAQENKLHIIEDAAQSIGSNYTFSNGSTAKSGTMGIIGTTSFFPSKNLGCFGDGGAIFTNDDEMAYKMRGIGNHGMYKRYYHDEIGINSRLDSIQAAILRKKLTLLEEYNNNRKKAADFYDEKFKNHLNIITPFRAEAYSTHVFHQYTLKIVNSDRDKLQAYLQELNIPSMIYYPVALHNQVAYTKETTYDNNDFPVTNKLTKEVISLPMHTELDLEQLEFITKSVLNFFN